MMNTKKALKSRKPVILVLNPYAITDISMQLSYAAVVAIIFVYPHIERILNIKFLEKMENGILKDSLKLTILSLCIQIVSMPLFLYYFEKLPLFSFLLNIIGVPIGTVLIETLFSITLLNILKDLKINRTLLRYRPRVSREQSISRLCVAGCIDSILNCYLRQFS